VAGTTGWFQNQIPTDNPFIERDASWRRLSFCVVGAPQFCGASTCAIASFQIPGVLNPDSVLRTHILPELGTLNLNEITPQHLSDFRDKVSGSLSSKTYCLSLSCSRFTARRRFSTASRISSSRDRMAGPTTKIIFAISSCIRRFCAPASSESRARTAFTYSGTRRAASYTS
jgi:hypothetical protein